MAFYPDELSPIERIRNLGKQTDSLSDIGPLKNRRQWKSLVLGKKDMGINNFATITEEKEEEISSDGSQGTNTNKNNAAQLVMSPGIVTNKKIIFPKPRKYITSRVSGRKEDATLRNEASPNSYDSLGSSAGESLNAETPTKTPSLSSLLSSSKSNLSEPKQLLKSGKSKELLFSSSQELVQNYALTETPIESQWTEAFSHGFGLGTWSKSNTDRTHITKHESGLGGKSKLEEKKKPNDSSKSSAVADSLKHDVKETKKKGGQTGKKQQKTKTDSPSIASEKAESSKGKQAAEKDKMLNMKEMVNVYKNLAYGSKEEIKSFVENLSLVKDNSKAESDKNLLSMMNLKALENKIKSFTKKTSKTQEPSTSKAKSKPKTRVKDKKLKPEKPLKKNRKAHIERLARHKVVRVPAVANNKMSRTAMESGSSVRSDQKGKKSNMKDKEPWRYVGMESILDKTYFVYPAYPPSVNLKNAVKTRKNGARGVQKATRQKKESTDVVSSKTSEPESSKVKSPQVFVRPSLSPGGGSHSYGVSVSGSASSKSMSRPSATTVCTVEFRPSVGQKSEQTPRVTAAEQSLLVYLHGTKPIHLKSPYSDKQFSRVKFFRKDDRGTPLIKGLGSRAAPKGCNRVSVRNISLPEKLTRIRSLDLLDFDEDIQNITDFLRSQDSPDRQRQQDWRGLKKTERESFKKESLKNQDDPSLPFLRHRRQENHEHHGPPSESLSPDSIINEITKSIQHLQYLPDTEHNRKMIGEFFDELDHQIEASRKGSSGFQKFPSPPAPQAFGPIPILGY